MEEVSLGVPRQILESLPEDGSADADMQRAVEGIEARVNDAIQDAEDTEAAAGYVVDAMERIEQRLDRHDEFVPELRAWGQSPIYAIAWRNLYADLIEQLYQHEWLVEELDRERNYRVVDDGIRFGT
ncbi:MAG: hypothetical protein A07HR60_00725 [uncultured archaeon A07HR60]|nr:MAG: hypothetical protein A07HR60_00725 [uncultured archaeon A07HR60]